MSETEADLIERLRRGYEAFNREDFDAVMAEFEFRPDFEFHPASATVPLEGGDAFRGWMEPDAFESQHIDPKVIRVVGNKILVVGYVTARGSASGVTTEMDVWTVWTLDDDGRMARLDIFQPQDKHTVLADLGLAEADLE